MVPKFHKVTRLFGNQRCRTFHSRKYLATPNEAPWPAVYCVTVDPVHLSLCGPFVQPPCITGSPYGAPPFEPPLLCECLATPKEALQPAEHRSHC